MPRNPQERPRTWESAYTHAIVEARAALAAAKRAAFRAWSLYEEINAASFEERGIWTQAAGNRAQAATHLPEDIRDLLEIDRYGSSTV